jgi:RNA polymerase sigma-70 factor (ECF subfamily)
MMRPPAELMERYCDGDADAFEELYGVVAPRLHAYLVCLASDRAMADDLLQLTFMKLHRARGAYVRGADPMPWLYTIAHRTFLDEVRRRERERQRLEADAGERPEPRAELDGKDDFERPMPELEPAVVQAVHAALARLPASQRQAVELTKLQGKSVAEAAVIAGTTPGAIKLRAHRGYAALRRMLQALWGKT